MDVKELNSKAQELYSIIIKEFESALHKVGNSSYSMNGYWMSTTCSFINEAGICIGPFLYNVFDTSKSFQVTKIESIRTGSGNKHEIRLYNNQNEFTVLPLEQNSKIFPYRTMEDFYPHLTILRIMEYLQDIG